MDVLAIFMRSVILFVAAVAAMRVMGKRQVGQLQPYELVVVIMIAELAATPMGSLGTPLVYGILPMLSLMICHGFMTGLCMVSERARSVICGQPTVLVRNGAICEKQLRKQAMTLSDLMEAMRSGGILDPAEMGTAVLETAGHVTVFPKAEHRPLTPLDMNKKAPQEGLPLPLILDGRVQSENLNRGGVTRAWLTQQLKALGYKDAGEVLFLSLNTQGALLCQGKGRTQTQQLQAMPEEQARW